MPTKTSGWMISHRPKEQSNFYCPNEYLGLRVKFILADKRVSLGKHNCSWSDSDQTASLTILRTMQILYQVCQTKLMHGTKRKPKLKDVTNNIGEFGMIEIKASEVQVFAFYF